MRVMDADKYCDFLNKYPLEKAQSNVMTFYRDALQYTFECEVDAIPIEWIKHWCLKHYPTYPRIITEELLKKTETWRMIEDWEKENETKIDRC